jgi:hypothetical protein
VDFEEMSNMDEDTVRDSFEAEALALLKLVDDLRARVSQTWGQWAEDSSVALTKAQQQVVVALTIIEGK